MKKISSLFQRNYDTDRLVRDELVPGAEWVQRGEGTPRLKVDGVCTMIRDGKLYKRYELKPGKAAPLSWEACDVVDEKTGKQMGWVPVGDGPEDSAMREALENTRAMRLERGDGTYEFLGPKSQGNVEGYKVSVLFHHASAKTLDAPRDFEGLRSYFQAHPEIEGIVWHHPDGRMVKIKGKDFGVKRVPSI